jgi:hypothetical protein
MVDGAQLTVQIVSKPMKVLLGRRLSAWKIKQLMGVGGVCGV